MAGVSHMTVSRVLNDHPYVKEETRAKVLAAMAKLGYRRNLTARALARRQSDTIGVIAFDTTLHGPASTLFSLEQAARAAGYQTQVVTVPDPHPQAFADAVDRLAGLAKEPAWWRRLYDSLAGVDPDRLSGLPVPLAGIDAALA